MGTPVIQKSAKSVTATMDALEAAVGAAGAKVIARVDHAKAAASVDLDLPEAQLLIFGNPLVGTPAMQADILAGLKLPLRVLVYAGSDGTEIAYDGVDIMFAGLNIAQDAEFLQKISGALAKLTAKAAA